MGGNSSGFMGVGALRGRSQHTGPQVSAEDIHTQGLFPLVSSVPRRHGTQERAGSAEESEECRMESFRKQESVYI